MSLMRWWEPMDPKFRTTTDEAIEVADISLIGVDFKQGADGAQSIPATELARWAAILEKIHEHSWWPEEYPPGRFHDNIDQMWTITLAAQPLGPGKMYQGSYLTTAIKINVFRMIERALQIHRMEFWHYEDAVPVFRQVYGAEPPRYISPAVRTYTPPGASDTRLAS